MKFSSARYWIKTGLPSALLVFLAGFGLYNVQVGMSPDPAMLLESFPQADPVFRAARLDAITDYTYSALLCLGLVQFVVLLVCAVPATAPDWLPLMGRRRRWMLHLQAFTAIAQLGLWFPRFYLIYHVPNVLFTTRAAADEFRFDAMWGPAKVAFLVLAVNLAWLVTLGLRETRNQFSPVFSREPEWGDRALQNLRTHGSEPDLRLGTYASLVFHWLVIFLIPWLLEIQGCVEPYYLPKGSGMAAAAQAIRIKRVKKEKPKKRLVFNMNSAISFHKPRIDESKIFEEMEEKTENQYQYTAARTGRMGAGGGTQGGWPTGVENAPIRFIRLKYGAGNWSLDMGEGADYNFLIRFAEETKFRIARRTEAIEISKLRAFPKGAAPPFVYITGMQGVSISGQEVKILRKYLLEEGGMIFANNGGGSFHPGFVNMMRQVLPEYQLFPIAHDDIIFQEPYGFPEGAPPLWHHSGWDALGIKHQGRWVVFYHQGDIDDAWKGGHSGIEQYKIDMAFKMGINVVYYAFTRYYEAHRSLLTR